MKEYDFDTFSSYYSGAWVGCPSGEERSYRLYFSHDRLLGVRPATNAATAVDIEKAKILDWKGLSWKDVKRPVLGYRHLFNGRVIVHAVGRDGKVPKGLQARRVYVGLPSTYLAASRAIGLSPPIPLDTSGHPCLGREVADAFRFPKYVRFEEAVKTLKESSLAMGFAINAQTAVCLGRTADKAFVLLFDGREVAISSDGSSWTPTQPEYENIVDYCKNLETE